MLFMNRKVTITLDKKDKGTDTEETHDDRPVEEKAEAILHTFERVAVKAFFGVCVYVMLDTHRQVAVAKANNPQR